MLSEVLKLQFEILLITMSRKMKRVISSEEELFAHEPFPSPSKESPVPEIVG